jgi:hypothetical protein
MGAGSPPFSIPTSAGRETALEDGGGTGVGETAGREDFGYFAQYECEGRGWGSERFVGRSR